MPADRPKATVRRVRFARLVPQGGSLGNPIACS